MLHVCSLLFIVHGVQNNKIKKENKDLQAFVFCV